MKQKLSLFFILMTSFCFARQTAPYGYFQLNYGNYTLGTLKQYYDTMQEDLVDQEIKVRTLDRFPPYFGYFTAVGTKYLTPEKPDKVFGVCCSFNSSGSRLSYGDYSADLLIDQLAYNVGCGLFYEIHHEKKPNVTISTDIKLLLTYSQVNFYEQVTIREERFTDTMYFHNFGLSLNPGVSFNYFYGPIFYKITGEVLIHYAKQAENGNGDLLYDMNGYKGNINWTGIRIGLSIGLNRNEKNK